MNPFDTRELLGVLENITPPTTLFTKLFFSQTDESTKAEVDVDVQENASFIAPFVKSRADSVNVSRKGFKSYTIKPDLVSVHRVTNAEDGYQRALGTTIYNAPGPDEILGRIMARDLDELVSGITNTVEKMAVDVVRTGVINTGVQSAIDFGRDSAHQIALTSGDVWGTSTAKIVANLRAWKRKIRQKTGKNANVAILGRSAYDALIYDTLLLKQMEAGLLAAQMNPNSLQQINADGAQYVGRLEGVDMWTYDGGYMDMNTNSFVEWMPADEVILGATDAYTTLLYGSITHMTKEGSQTYMGPYIPHSFIDENANARKLVLESRPLAALHQVNAFVKAKVL